MKFFCGFLAALAMLTTGCGRNDSAASDQPAGPKGSIRGLVRLHGEAPKPATDAITQDQNTCGSSASLPRIALGKDNGIENTFVVLEGVPNVGRPRPAPAKQALLIDQKACQYVPHAMIVPLGSTVEITNSDPILHNVNGKQFSDAGLLGVFNYAQARQGQRETLNMSNTRPGIISLSCEAGHPWMSAFLYVAKDPYIALTDANGEFVIKDVPPGTYTLKMWHEGVTLKSINKKLQLYQYEEPYELTQQVTIAANGETTANFDLELRK